MARKSQFETRLARTPDELRAAQALRYRVFVTELGGDGDMVDHKAGLEMDRFDPFFDHMLLLDHARPDAPVVGVYRLLRGEQAQKAGQFYSEDEYDLTVLRESGRSLLELGRSCVDADYRGGPALFHLWNGLADYVLDHGIEVMFGVASFHGTDVQALAQPLSYLHHRHLAPPDLRVRAQEAHFQPMDLIPDDQLDRKQAIMDIPQLIKAYLRLGGFVGEGAFIDHAFNTTDVCLIMDTERLNARQANLYSKGRAA
ncbi:GNAT family N-acetyltransferase [Pseudaestuariivita rosea]|uniref:GNAT family N-acetyltransferase n=1 Tax=Pseudaestuariivita rosea TaxID=2763263 RepID=UPI001ABADD1D|nr:GNAT family N-acyltransferase [Pseudaestuariivita rosea]